jgi:hypothetical protein
MGRRRVAHFQRLSISAIISSAQRTESAIALTVAGTRVPPSYIASLRAVNDAVKIDSDLRIHWPAC